MKRTGLLLVLLLLMIGCRNGGLSDEELEDSLWLGTWVEMPGLSSHSLDVFGYIPSLKFISSSKAELNLDGELIKLTYTRKDNELLLKGKGFKSQAFLGRDYKSGELEYLYLIDVKNKGLNFYKESKLEEDRKKAAEKDEEKKKEIASLRSQMGSSLDLVNDYFVSWLIRDGFDKAALVDQGDERVENYVQELSNLGLLGQDWSVYFDGDPDIILDAYEDFIFNASFSEEDRKARSGQLISVSKGVVVDEIFPLIEIRKEFFDDYNRASHYIEDYIDESRRSFGGNFEFEIKEKLAEPPQVEVLEAWRSDKYCFLRLGLEEGEGWYVVYEGSKDWRPRYSTGRFFSYNN